MMLVAGISTNEFLIQNYVRKEHHYESTKLFFRSTKTQTECLANPITYPFVYWSWVEPSFTEVCQ